MKFGLKFFLNNLLFLLVQTQIIKKIKDNKQMVKKRIDIHVDIFK